MSYPYPQGGGGYRPGYWLASRPLSQPEIARIQGLAGAYAQGSVYLHQGYQPPPQQQQSPPGVDPNVFQWFMAVNTDRSGRISAKELQTVLANGNRCAYSEDTCRMMIGMFDRQRMGTIDATEFQALLNYLQQWRSVFDRFDAERSRFVEQAELEEGEVAPRAAQDGSFDPAHGHPSTGLCWCVNYNGQQTSEHQRGNPRS